MNILETQKIYKRFKDITAVDNVSFAMKEGEIFGLLGPNGAGKSTSINIISGLITKYEGDVIVEGKKLNGNSAQVKQMMGIVPQEIAVYKELTPEENLSFFGGLYGLKGRELKEAVDRTLEFIGLTDVRKKRVKQFSGGMMRRLNIGCGMVHRPKLLIMDEPTVGIDPQSRNHILEAIHQANEEGMSVLYTTHYMEEAQELCDRIAIMDQGKIIANGSLEELQAIIVDSNFLELRLQEGDPLDQASLRQIDGVKNVTQDRTLVQIESDRTVDNLNQVISWFADQKITIHEIQTKKPDLEDIFLALTGKQLRD